MGEHKLVGAGEI